MVELLWREVKVAMESKDEKLSTLKYEPTRAFLFRKVSRSLIHPGT